MDKGPRETRQLGREGHEKTSGPVGAAGTDRGQGVGGAVSSHCPGQDRNTPLPFISMIHLRFPAVSVPTSFKGRYR